MIARGTAGGREPVGLFFAIDMVVHLLLNGIHWLPATALKTPMSVYLTLVPCAWEPADTRYIRADTCAGRSVLFLGGGCSPGS